MFKIYPKVDGLMRGKYFARGIIPYTYLYTVDLITKSLLKNERINFDFEPKKILLCNSAHLGDCLLTLTLIPKIKKIYPNIKIGILTGLWNKEIIEIANNIDYVHYVEHWKLNRKNINLVSKFTLYFLTFKNALKEIKKISYDVGIDFYPFFPNSSLLLYLSGIPIRVGFTSGGFGELYTHKVDFVYQKRLIVEYFIELLSIINPEFLKFKAKDYIQSVLKTSEDCKNFLLKKYGLTNHGYIIIHPCSGSSIKIFPNEKIINLISAINKHTSIKIVLTGYGPYEEEYNNKISNVFYNVLNLTSKLSIKDLVCLYNGAKLFIGVDSFAGHLASILGVKNVILYNGVLDSEIWKPIGENSFVVYPHIDCAPCYKKKGCYNMHCFNLDVERVLEIIRKLL